MMGEARWIQTRASLGLIGAALILGLTPWFGGVGWAWTLVAAAGAFAVWRQESPASAAAGRFPVVRAGFAALCAALAWQMLDWGLTPLLWLLGAAVLCAEYARRLPVRRLLSGYRPYLVLGVAVCLLALLQTWDRTTGAWSFGWTGGMTTASHYNALTGYYENQLEYQPMMYPNNWYWPGFVFSGRSRPFAVWAELALVGLLVWAAWGEARHARAGAGLAGFLALWLVTQRAPEAGPRVFLLGLLLIGFALWMLLRGREEGPGDAQHLWRLVRARLARPRPHAPVTENGAETEKS